MKFEDVLPAFRKGKKIRRKIWSRIDAHISVPDNCGCWEFTREALFADDWEVVEEPKKPMVFEGIVSYGYYSEDGRPEKPAYSDSFDNFILGIVHPSKYKKQLRVTIEELP